MSMLSHTWQRNNNTEKEGGREKEGESLTFKDSSFRSIWTCLASPCHTTNTSTQKVTAVAYKYA